MTYGETIRVFWPRRHEGDGPAAYRLARIVSALYHKHGLATEDCARQMFERALGCEVELEDFRAVMSIGFAEQDYYRRLALRSRSYYRS